MAPSEQPQSSLGTLLRSTATYSINALVGPLFALALTPIYTRVLRPEDYGVLSLVRTLGVALAVIGKIGFDTVLSATMHEQPDDEARVRLASVALWLAVALSALLALAVGLAAQPLAAFWLGDARYAPELVVVALNLPFAAIYTLQVAIFRLRHEAWNATALGLVHIVGLAALNLLLVVWLRLGVLGAVAAETITYGLINLLALLLAPHYLLALLRGLAKGWNPWPAARLLLLAGLPLVPAGLATWGTGYIDRPLLLQLGVSRSDIGLYDNATKLSSVLTQFSIPFQAAWLPFALGIKSRPDAPGVYARALTLYMAAMLGAGLALGLFAHEALLLVTTPSYLGAQNYVWVLAYAPPLQGSVTLLLVGLYLTRKTLHLAWIAALGVGVNIVLNLLLVPQLGAMGAAIATPLSYGCSIAATYIVVQRAYPLPYEVRSLALLVIAQALLLQLGLPLGQATSPGSLAGRALLLAIYPLALIALGVIRRADIMDLLRKLQRA